MEQGVDSGLVGLETVHQVLLEALHAIRKNARAVQKVADHDGLEHVKLELTVHTTNGSSDVVTHNLGADHGKGLALSGVDLSRHDRGAGLVLGEDQLAQTATRSRTEVTDILGDLEERASKGVKGTRGLDDRIVSSENLELVGGGLEFGASHLGDLGGNGLIKALEGVQTSTDSSSTLSKIAEVGKRVLNALNVAIKLGNVAGELLTKSKRSSILQMGTTDLDDLLKVLHLHLESIAKALEGRQQSSLELQNSSDVHSSRERVVGGSRHVDVVVGVHRLLRSHLATQDLDGTVRDDLVGVHVGLGAGTSLPNDKREVVHELALGNLGGSLLNSLTNLGV